MTPMHRAILLLIFSTIWNFTLSPFLSPCRYRAHCGRTTKSNTDAGDITGRRMPNRKT
ncbi:MAG: hypothetical protein AAGC70_21495 [Pseudomonadota bacterium]